MTASYLPSLVSLLCRSKSRLVFQGCPLLNPCPHCGSILLVLAHCPCSYRSYSHRQEKKCRQGAKTTNKTKDHLPTCLSVLLFAIFSFQILFTLHRHLLFLCHFASTRIASIVQVVLTLRFTHFPLKSHSILTQIAEIAHDCGVLLNFGRIRPINGWLRHRHPRHCLANHLRGEVYRGH